MAECVQIIESKDEEHYHKLKGLKYLSEPDRKAELTFGFDDRDQHFYLRKQRCGKIDLFMVLGTELKTSTVFVVNTKRPDIGVIGACFKEKWVTFGPDQYHEI